MSDPPLVEDEAVSRTSNLPDGMTFQHVRNILCVLRSIDLHELIEEGALRADDTEAWLRFRENPYEAVLRWDTERTNAVWRIIWKRLKP